MQTLDADITRVRKENNELRQQFELLRKSYEDLKVRSCDLELTNKLTNALFNFSNQLSFQSKIKLGRL